MTSPSRQRGGGIETKPPPPKPKTVTVATATSVNVNGVTPTTGNCGGLHVPGTRSLVVHAAWRTDPEIAVEIVLTSLAGHRAPEPLRRARRAAREARTAAF